MHELIEEETTTLLVVDDATEDDDSWALSSTISPLHVSPEHVTECPTCTCACPTLTPIVQATPYIMESSATSEKSF